MSDSSKGGLNFDQLSGDFYDAEVHRRWVYLHDRVANHEIPPAKEAEPTPTARAEFLQHLGKSLTQADLATREVALRRLNRNEYENTVNDLFGIQVDLQRILPSDEREQGFDNNGSDLAISAEQMVTYLETSDQALDQVFGPTEKPETKQIKLKFSDFRDIDRADRLTNEGGILDRSRNFPGAKSSQSRTK